MTVSFVQALDIARDPRLAGLRSGDTPEIMGARRGGTESASGSAESPLYHFHISMTLLCRGMRLWI
jgi:hypothetical protein